MTHTAIERSEDAGELVELYRFVRGTTEWFYVDNYTSVTYDGDVYLPLEISRTAPRQSSSDSPGTIDVTLPSDCALVALLQQGGNLRTVDLTIIGFHRSSPTATRITFLGEVTVPNIEPSLTVLTCAPLAGQMGQQVPRGTVQRNECIWTTYDLFTCKVSIAAFTFTTAVSAISLNGLEVTVTGALAFVPTLPGSVARSDMFAKGVLVKGEQRGEIIEQVGEVMYLSERMPGLVLADAISLVAGDNRTPETCRDKFQNAARMMVHPHMPQVNPFFGQGFGSP